MRTQIDETLKDFLSIYEDSPTKEAVEYSLLSGGKRVRPLLLLSLLKDYKEDPALGLDVAMALELIQTYSLVHDDLPAMDDDDFRRGQPANHIVYGEATALLAGDAMLTSAFEVIATSNYSPEVKVDLISLFAQRAGLNGMILGQTLDLQFIEKPTDKLNDLLKMYDLKTGALLATALEATAILVNKQKDRESLRKIGYMCGRAFQVQDDIFDATKTKEELGKSVGSDEAMHKVTALTFMSLEEATTFVASTYGEIRQHLSKLKLDNGEVYEMIEYLMSRKS
ncbi:MAG: polyprenyl synthetase family protein [Erysipelothrix sp.]|nr:polyprenyl synthetase family protein [Erysipelothrix sp.]